MEESNGTSSGSPEVEESKGIPNPITELIDSFRALKDAPKGFWYCNYAYWLDGISYFGILTLLAMFLHDVVGLSDEHGHKIVSAYMGMITGFMLIFGPISDRLGVRKSLIISGVLYVIGRSVLPLAPDFFPVGSSALVVVLFVGLMLAAVGNGFMQPSVYAGVRKFSDEKTAAMGYGLLYAGMNLGIVFIGLVSSRIRTGLHIEGVIDLPGFGINGVFWFCIAVNLFMLLGLLIFFTPRVEREGIRREADEAEDEPVSGEARQAGDGFMGAVLEWLQRSPILNGRFMFFIFALMPVQTLFAYQFLVMPQFVTRAFSPAVADNMETIVNVANPLIIVLGVPIITAMTGKVSVYRMMLVGSLVSAVPTFLFLFPPNFYLLMAYLLLFSLGEAMWQPRFLQFAAELAPEGMTGAYVAWANLPWFMIKFIAGWYTGSMMDLYCPADGPLRTESMWLIYGLVAMISPTLLLIGSRWVKKGLEGRMTGV